MSLLALDQIAILITGPAAIILIGLRQPWRRWGFLVGLAGQPFWLYSSWEGRQWGIFMVSCFMVYAWCFGAWKNWEKKGG